MMMNAEKYNSSNCLQNAGATLLAATSSCITDFFFCNIFMEQKMLAVHCIALWNHYVVMETVHCSSYG